LRLIAYYSKKSRGETPENTPIEVTVYNMARMWGKLPYEIWQMPASEFYKLIDLNNIEAKFDA
jgi:hypothetical protein